MDLAQCDKVVSFCTKFQDENLLKKIRHCCTQLCKFMHYCTYDLVALMRGNNVLYYITTYVNNALTIWLDKFVFSVLPTIVCVELRQ